MLGGYFIGFERSVELLSPPVLRAPSARINDKSS